MSVRMCLRLFHGSSRVPGNAHRTRLSDARVAVVRNSNTVLDPEPSIGGPQRHTTFSTSARNTSKLSVLRSSRKRLPGPLFEFEGKSKLQCAAVQTENLIACAHSNRQSLHWTTSFTHARTSFSHDIILSGQCGFSGPSQLLSFNFCISLFLMISYPYTIKQQ